MKDCREKMDVLVMGLERERERRTNEKHVKKKIKTRSSRLAGWERPLPLGFG